MAYLRLIEAAQQGFQGLPPEKNVLILHPQFRYHTLLVNALIEAAGANTLYITLPEQGATLAYLWEKLRGELAELYEIGSVAAADLTPQVAADLFCQVVADITPLMVVLMAYDNADDDIHAFLAQVGPCMPGQVRFVLSSRTWVYDLASRLRGSGSIALLPTSEQDMLLDYFDCADDPVVLEVRALGSGQVWINGRQITQWDGALPRMLFFYFVDKGMATRDEVFATFWPEVSVREATNVFHVTKRKISEILGVDLTVYSSGFYRISSQFRLHYDVVAFVEAVQNSAVAEDGVTVALLERAIALHERDFLSGLDQLWAAKRRAELQQVYVDALTELARHYEEDSRYREALSLYNRAFGICPQREDIARAQMRLYQRHGTLDLALAVYDRLSVDLEQNLGVSPSPETVALARQIRGDG